MPVVIDSIARFATLALLFTQIFDFKRINANDSIEKCRRDANKSYQRLFFDRKIEKIKDEVEICFRIVHKHESLVVLRTHSPSSQS